MLVIEKARSHGMDTSALKANIDELKKEVNFFWSFNLSTFFDGLEDPPLKMVVAIIPNKRLNVEVPGDGGKEN